MILKGTLRNIPLFKNLNDEDLELVASHLQKKRYPKGSVIFKEGDEGDAMYLVESGQVAVVSQDVRETIAFMGPGNFVGEISLLLTQPRTATLQVMIDAELWAFYKKDFEKLILSRPAIAREMMRELGRRLIATTQRKQPLPHRRITALFGGHKAIELCQAIHQKLKKPVGLLLLPGAKLEGQATISGGIMLLGSENLTEASLAEGLSYQVEVFKQVVLLIPNRPSGVAWKALELADTVVSIGQPPNWFNSRNRPEELWIIGETEAEIWRIARRLTNRSVGLALSSGGARGLAHIGVLKVLMEENIPIDMMAGTSGGAWFGAFYCAGWTIEQFDYFVKNIKKIILRLPNADFNLIPRTALFKGVKARDRVIAQLVGVDTFDALQTPLYIVAADILSGDEVVFASGSLTDAIRASLSVPILFDPWHYQERYFVDGGVVNPLPASVLREHGADIVIGSSVIQPLRDSYGGRKDRMPHILTSVFNMFSAMEAEVIKKQLPLVDILIQHRVSAKHTLDFDRADEIVRAGEAAARQALPKIKAAIETPPET